MNMITLILMQKAWSIPIIMHLELKVKKKKSVDPFISENDVKSIESVSATTESDSKSLYGETL